MPFAACAAEIALVGLLPNKAVVVIDGGRARAMPVGSAQNGVKLVSLEEGAAVFEIDGRRRRFVLGEHTVSNGGDDGSAATVTLTADGRGHFSTLGSINGASVRFLVDTGATLVSMGAADAVRANIDYRKGQPAMTMTANGPTKVWRVTLNSVKLGSVTLHQVDAAVHEHDLPVTLLGMSFLNRMEMKRDGSTMTLKKRF